MAFRGTITGLLCLMAVGCHSVRFGPSLSQKSTSEITLVRATFGPPTTATIDEPPLLQQTGMTEQPQPGLDFRLGTERIDLPTALARAGADNPTIALADEAVRASLADHMQARALLFPTLSAGMNVRVHRGNFISGRGAVIDVDLQSLYRGAGADTKGAGTLAIPGVRLVSHLGDAWYAPQAAQQQVVRSRFEAAATRNYLLMEVGMRYLALVEAEARLAAYRQSLDDLGAIEKLTADFAKAKQGRDADAQRARTEKLLLTAEAQRAEEGIGVAAAELARLLDADPAVALRAADLTPPLLELIDKSASVPQLLDQAMAAHPELIARDAEVGFQAIRLRQERVRPLLPVIAVGFSAGQFGGSGTDTVSRFSQYSGRTDLDIVAIWSLQNFAVGNRAVQNVVQSNLESAQLERAAVIDRIRREVVEAHALVQSRRQEMELASKRVASAQAAYTQDLTRARNVPGRPIEVLSSANQLAAARQDLVRAMAGYSQAQLQLHAALGNAPDKVTR